MTLGPAPARLFDDDGNAQYGIWRGYGPSVQTQDYGPWKRGDIRALFTEKRWLYIGLSSPEYLLGLAVVNVGYLGTGWLYLYEMKSGKLLEWSAKSPFAKGVKAERDPKTGLFSFVRGSRRIEIQSDTPSSYRKVNLDLSGAAGKIKGNIAVSDDGQNALGFLGEPSEGRFNLTYKSAGLPAEAKLELDGKEIVFKKASTRAHVDWTWGCPPRKTFWNWSAASGVMADGRSLGWNFGAGLNEGRNFQNIVWLDGNITQFGKIHFEYKPEDILAPWQMFDDKRSLHLEFKPCGIRKENINIILVQSRFQQPFGSYSGYITTADGQRLQVADMLGVAEEHYAKW